MITELPLKAPLLAALRLRAMAARHLCTQLRRWGAAIALAGVMTPTLAEPLAWPERITRIEDMPLQTRLHLSIPSLRVKGDVQRELIVKLLVDERGAVVRGTVLQSCGNTDVDEAVLHALREARFQPFVEDGVAQAVSLVMPLHLPKWRAR
ncbi:MAG: hypothetical protein C4K60_02710 [Ideonella sp. MAG2]|nr:MAG: hypothetical protein C4K60_02710 [Ideonella sp. MAG2]